MPLDRTIIKTKLGIHPQLFDDPKSFIHKHDLPIRSSKLFRSRFIHGQTQSLNLTMLTHKGISVKLKKFKGDRLTDVDIGFNPGVCLRAHNGAVLSLTEFLHALALLITHFKPLLFDQNDWVDIVPGLRSEGFAYWHCIEIQFQYFDPDDKLLSSFRQVVPDHPKIPVRHWLASMHIGGHKSDRLFRVYNKGREMVAHRKLDPLQLSEYGQILRLEVRLKNEKLHHYLGNERNVENIGGQERLVRFYPQDVFLGFRKCFNSLNGVYHQDSLYTEESPNHRPNAIGRLFAQTALDPRCSPTFLELIEHLRFHSERSSKSIAPIKNAGIQELSRLSKISEEHLFSEAAFSRPYHVSNKELEQKVCYDLKDTIAHPLIYHAYQPLGQPFKPVIKWPGYVRI